MDNTQILTAGTPIYSHEGHRRHVATVLSPVRDYNRDTVSYYEITRHDGSYGVVSSDFIEVRYEGRDAQDWHAFNTDPTV